MSAWQLVRYVGIASCGKGADAGLDPKLGGVLYPCRFGWTPYPDWYAFPFMCEKPQALYACNLADAPPAPEVPNCECPALAAAL